MGGYASIGIVHKKYELENGKAKKLWTKVWIHMCSKMKLWDLYEIWYVSDEKCIWENASVCVCRRQNIGHTHNMVMFPSSIFCDEIHN